MKAKKNVLTLIKKIESLPQERIIEVKDFVEFLRHKVSDSLLTKVAAKISEKAFSKVWDNPGDAIYDRSLS